MYSTVFYSIRMQPTSESERTIFSQHFNCWNLKIMNISIYYICDNWHVWNGHKNDILYAHLRHVVNAFATRWKIPTHQCPYPSNTLSVVILYIIESWKCPQPPVFQLDPSEKIPRMQNRIGNSPTTRVDSQPNLEIRIPARQTPCQEIKRRSRQSTNSSEAGSESSAPGLAP